MKTFPSKFSFAIFLLVFLLSFLITHQVWADLLDQGKSDSTIKMLVFPKSLRVVESHEFEEIDAAFYDPKQIRKTLLKLDPARVAPANTGEPIKGPVSRDSLKQLAQKYNEDIIFIFRRKLGNDKKSILHQGLLYLAKQKKVLALKEILSSSTGSFVEMDMAGLKALAQEARQVIHFHKFEKRQSAY